MNVLPGRRPEKFRLSCLYSISNFLRNSYFSLIKLIRRYFNKFMRQIMIIFSY